MREAIVSIAAGRSQLSLIEAARGMGLAVLAVDRDPRAEGMRRAHEALVASTHDPEAVLRALAPLRRRYEILGVATKSSGAPVATCARVASELGLPGLNPELAPSLVTKPGLLDACERAGVPAPRHRALASEAQLGGLDLVWPLVVKPASGTVGKAGVTLVHERAELLRAYREATTVSEDGVVDVEEYVAGEDVVLAGLMDASRFRPLLAVDEDTRFQADGRVRGFGFGAPSRFADGPVEECLVEHAERLVGTLQLGTGVAFLTFRVDDAGDARLIEAHFDLAGDWLADRLFPAVTDFPLIPATLRLLIGHAVPPGPPTARRATLRFLYGADWQERVATKLEVLRGWPETLRIEVTSGARPDPERRIGFVLVRGAGRELGDRIDRALGRSSGFHVIEGRPLQPGAA